MRLALALAFILVACGGRSPGAPSPHGSAPAPSADAGLRLTTDDVPSVEHLAERGAGEAVAMREVARTPEAKAPIELQAGTADTCYRAIVAANEPVTAWFESEDRDRRGVPFSGTTGFVPPAGPACFRKGTRLRLVVERAHATIARAIIWASP